MSLYKVEALSKLSLDFQKRTSWNVVDSYKYANTSMEYPEINQS